MNRTDQGFARKARYAAQARRNLIAAQTPAPQPAAQDTEHDPLTCRLGGHCPFPQCA